MLTTNPGRQFGSAVADSTVTYFGGTARIGNSLRPFAGARMAFSSMTALGDGTPGWQNVLLYLSQADSSASGLDMAASASSVAASRLAAAYPSMPDSNGFPLGVFLFHSDGTAVTLEAQQGI